MERPFFHTSIDELEAAFDHRRSDVDFLRALIEELSHRSTDRAARLKARAVQALGTAEKARPSRTDRVTSTDAQPPRPHPSDATRVRDTAPSSPRAPTPPVTNTPEAILSAWTAIEVLSPPSFRRPEDLAGGDRRAVAPLDRERLPWEGPGEKARPRTRLYYQIVLGTVNLEAAVAKLLACYADTRAERPPVRGDAILAVVVIDREGRPVEAPAVAISSFGWGVPRALRDDLAVLAKWRAAERPLIEKLDEMLRHTDADGKIRSLDRVTITAAYDWLVAVLDLSPDLVTLPRFAIRTYEYYKNPEPPEPRLLNSFFLNDLAVARGLFADGRASTNLRRYVGCEVPATRRDLLYDKAALEAAVAPARMPPTRWPGPGRHPLVLLQQAAVNLALHELRDTGILAVNGPPGTGKTTLLRDLVAALVTARAEVMAKFDDPASAFVHSGEKLRAGQAWLHLYRLDDRLKGFEIVVASSNNKAVENVSAELPGLKAIADDAGNLRYFATLSDELLGRETWGLIAAVLGNAANRNRFRQAFWWNEDAGLSTYLAAAAGTPQTIEIKDPETGRLIETRPPRIVISELPPRDHNQALERWRKRRGEFRTILEKSRATLKALAEAHEMAARLPSLSRAETEAGKAVGVCKDTEARAMATVEEARVCLAQAQARVTTAEERLAEHDRMKPSFFARLFIVRGARDWSSAHRPLVAARAEASKIFTTAELSVSASEKAYREAVAKRQVAARHRAEVAELHAIARRQVASVRERVGAHFVDAAFFAREHGEKHVSTPWLDVAAQRIRDDVFIAAMKLHKAFVDAAAKPLRHNLGVLMSVFSGRSPPQLISDVWASFFLVVPLVSTTFASVERTLGALPPESLGWLLVDEAGQALPQTAVGALMRTRRAVVVGDPIQIEPVVVLPDTLTQAICRQFGIDPDRFNAPDASVQTLADAATPYVAEFQGRYGSRTVGVPLLVHRRCAEPMFGISNAVAYNGLMVNAKAAKPSRIRDIIGPSAWIDVQGSAQDKWCPQEGGAAMALLRRLAATDVGAPDLYIVTPFVIVADNLRRLVSESRVLGGWTDDPWGWTHERIGTVHTVQGREAEAVIFVLGAPAPQQDGARRWAGGRPNLLNVAVTRAKEALYVIGNRRLWREAGLFRELDARLP